MSEVAAGVVVKNSSKFTEKYLCPSFFVNKVALLKKETPTHVFSCEFCEVFMNTVFYRTPLVADSLIPNILLSNAEETRIMIFFQKEKN